MALVDRRFGAGLLTALAVPLAVAPTARHGNVELAKPAAQIVADATAAMKNAKSFHVLGHIDEQGTAMVLNLSLSPRGGGGSVELSGAALQVVVNPTYVYVKGDAKSWLKLTGDKATAQLVANRWIKAPRTSSSFASFADLTVPKAFVVQFMSGESGFSKLPRLRTFDGRSAVVLTDAQGDKLYVANNGTPYILEVQGTARGSSGTMVFSDFGDAPMPATPVNAISLPGLSSTSP
ncbi:MAG: hypothetical protein ACP5VR_04510 [Acidimicrobiales bacterium]